MNKIMAPLREIIKPYAPALEAEMRALVEEPPNPRLARFYDMLAYHMGWRDANLRPADQRTGKWIRPAMCLLACEAAGGDWKRAVPAAAAIELTHNFTLIHDDIQDGDAERRGRPTVWKLWGVPQGINAGDALFVLAHTALDDLHQHGYDAATIRHVYRSYDQACLRLVEGQYLDISFEDRLDVGVDEYLMMIAGKTAALLSTSLEIGARLATGDGRIVHAYREFGEELGLTFQIVDDVLGIWGDEAVTGKPAGNDLRRKKKSLPVVYTLQQETGDAGPLHTLYQKETLTEKDVDAALDILERAGAREYARDLARKHRQRAMRVLAKTAVLAETAIENPAQSRLRGLATFLIEREF